jgi:hypothetical protein
MPISGERMKAPKRAKKSTSRDKSGEKKGPEKSKSPGPQWGVKHELTK